MSSNVTEVIGEYSNDLSIPSSTRASYKDSSTTEHASIDGLCDECSKYPWDDPSAMSKRRKILIAWNTNGKMTCPLCLFFKDYRSLKGASDYTYAEFITSLSISSLGFECIVPGSDACCVLLDTWAGNIFDEPTLLISRHDHDRTMTQLRQIYPQEASVDLARDWIAHCEKHHGACMPQNRSRIRNLKVIDCFEKRVVAAPEECKFVALSYVWGDANSGITGVTDHLPRCDLLPRLIQQCIQLTCNLGYKYLWIDRYCIRQDNSEDQKIQINQMGDIYDAAHLMIIAAAGKDPSYGLPGILPTSREPLRHEGLGSSHIYALPTIRGLQDVFIFSEWVTRAWTYQEGFFSRRRLIFTDRQMIFVCNTSTLYEAKTEGMVDVGDRLLTNHTQRNSTRTRSDRGEWALERAQRYLEGYSGRSLGLDEDALKAISGALNTLVTERAYHIWGVPFRYYVSEETSKPKNSDAGPHGEILLAWKCYSPPDDNRRRRFPSWSPLGWRSRIYFWPPADISGILVQTEQSGTNLLDLVPESGIISTGCSQQLRLESATADFHICASRGHPIAFHYRYNIYVYFEVSWDIDVKKLEIGSIWKGVLLPTAEYNKSGGSSGSAFVLLVEPHGQCYERVGIAELTYSNPYGSHDQDFEWEGRVYRPQDPPDIEQEYWWKRLFKKEVVIIG